MTRQRTDIWKGNAETKSEITNCSEDVIVKKILKNNNNNSNNIKLTERALFFLLLFFFLDFLASDSELSDLLAALRDRDLCLFFLDPLSLPSDSYKIKVTIQLNTHFCNLFSTPTRHLQLTLCDLDADFLLLLFNLFFLLLI